ncbi:MAG: LPS export ABC transporter periplasmic protein LptC [bacterium]
MASHRPLLLLLLLVSVVLVFIQRHPDQTPLTEPKLFRDNYFLLEFSTLAFNEQGKPETVLTGDRLNQPVNSGEHHVIKPVIRRLEGSETRWEVRAQQGMLNEPHTHASLGTDVWITHISGEEGASAINIQTKRLDLDIPAQIASTQERVTVKQGSNRLTGRGMQANLQQARITLKADTQATYVAE